MIRLMNAFVFLSALGSGLIAGLFFAFSAFVMTALSKLPSHQGMASMQSINIHVLNPLFLGVFMGTTLLSVILAVQSLLRWGEPGTALALTGSLFYLIGSFLVTAVVHVPLNDALAAVQPGRPESDMQKAP